MGETTMLRKINVLLVPLVLLFPAISYSDSSGPTNFDECIVDTMRGVSSDVAAQAIIDSCRNLFPDSSGKAAPPPPPAPAAPAAPVANTPPPAAPAPLDTAAARSLSTDELAQLRAKARIFGSAYRITIENNNPNLTLTEVTIAVWDDGNPLASRKEYSEAAQIAPQSSATVKYTVHYRGDETGWNWGVVAARGVE
jgi:pyruvate/2-oxoglutarate dehydrogenase complex dihydrolipoamide acyltransferase (E2) component